MSNNTMTEATFIKLTAKAGKEHELADFLQCGASLVKQHEPNTVFWSALQLDERTFAIFDTFTDENGRSAHFAGKVAGALKENAEALVEGGWEDGVLSNVQNFKIIALS